MTVPGEPSFVPAASEGGTPVSTLARAGFLEPERARRLLAGDELGPLGTDPLLREALSRSADPDLALTSLVRLLGAATDAPELRDTLMAAKPFRDRLLTVLGLSAALGDHLVRHPTAWHALVEFDVDELAPEAAAYRSTMLAAVGAPDDTSPAHLTGDAARDALRVAYRGELLRIAVRDLCGTIDVMRAAWELADLADATLRAALAVALAERPVDAPACRLAVIGMGKCGGRELNYVSDVDVVFVAEPAEGVPEAAALTSAEELAATLMRVCSDTTAEGQIWPVDAALRPEGNAGPLVRTLASHLAYYERWAKTWEFQALLKARYVAGDEELANAYLDAVAPMVWRAASRERFVEDVQAMRRRVVETLPVSQAGREIKLGSGGLRDVEFAVQLLQLVHGRTDEELRSGGTLPALRALAAGGYVGRADAAELDDAYRFLRVLEHRLQLYRLRRTHTLPKDQRDLRRLGRSLGFVADPVTRLDQQWRKHAREVRRLHEKLFYRPLLSAVASLPSHEAALTSEAAVARLEALGYADPASALRHLRALTTGVSRRAAIQRTLVPVMLGWFADAADPDGGLLAFRRVSEALGNTHWYLRLLRDEGTAAEHLARVLASGRYAPDLLLRAPEAVALLGEEHGPKPRDRDSLRFEVMAAVGRAESAEQAAAAARAVRRRELFRTAAADLLGMADVDIVGEALTAVTAVTIQGAMSAACVAAERRRGAPLPTRIAVIAMGRFGGHEMNYGSDADVLFVHEPRDGADEAAASDVALEVTNAVRQLLALPTADPPLLIDPDLRPEGRQGPMVRTLASYRAYYARWSDVWESQALLRAEHVAGDPDLGHRFIELVDPLRYPASGLDEADLREIRRIKARVESERLPRGADRWSHTKLGPGGLADIEWTAQVLQLGHAARLPGLRTTSTRGALRAACSAGLLDREDTEELDTAWTLTTRVRNAITLVRGQRSDSLPTQARELAGIASCLGFDGPGEFLDEYRRRSRRARAVVERVFYGAE